MSRLTASDMAVKDPKMIRAVEKQMRATSPKTRLARRQRSAFRVKWVRFPATWGERLRKTRSANTYHLAVDLLFAAFRAEQSGFNANLVLSAQITGLSASSRKRAARELEKLGLIQTRRKGQSAPEVKLLLYINRTIE